MKRSSFSTSAILVLILLVSAVPVFAGGWATITLDAWPAQITANEPVVIGFTVRQHGRDESRMAGLSPTIQLKNSATDKSFIVNAKEEGPVGHYSATIIFPSAGAWSWSVQAFSMDQPMPKLTVSDAALKTSTPAPVSPTPAILAGFLGLAFVGLAVVLAWRKRTRWALALVVVGLLAWGVGVASAANQSASLAPSAGKSAVSKQVEGKGASDQEMTNQDLTQAEYGKVLFVAKGCATCHVNPQIELAYTPLRIDVGKNLSGYVASPEFLRMWLKDPKSVKPQTEMPNLELKETEIEALIAFLSSPQDKK